MISNLQTRAKYDPYSNDLGENFSEELQDYREQDLLPYIEDVKRQLSTLVDGDTRKAALQKNLNTALAYLQEVDGELSIDFGSEWDPLENKTGEEDKADPSDPSRPHPDRVTDDYLGYDSSLSTFVASPQDKKEVRFTSPPYNLTLPGSATAHVSTNPKDSSQLVVTVTWPDGKTTRYVYEHTNWKTFGKLHFNAASPEDQVSFDKGLEDKVDLTCADAGEGAEIAATNPPPNEVKDGRRTWSKASAVDYYVTEGKETDFIYATSLDITLSDQRDTVRSTYLGDNHHRFEIYDSEGKLIRTIETFLPQPKNGDAAPIHFKNLNPDHLKCKDLILQAPASEDTLTNEAAKVAKIGSLSSPTNSALPDNDGFVKWSDFQSDAGISLEGFAEEGGLSAGKPVNVKAKNDTPADEINLQQKTASYGTQSIIDEVELTADYESADRIDRYVVNAGTQFTFNRASNADQVTITKNKNGRYTIVSACGGKTQTFYVTAPKIVLNASLIPQGNIQYIDKTQIPSVKSDYVPGMDPVVSVPGEPASKNQTDAVWPSLNEMLDNLPNNDSHDQSVELVRLMNRAAKDAAKATREADKAAAWTPVEDYLKGLADVTSNNVVRQVLTALNEIAGTGDAFGEFLKLIPNSTKDSMIEALSRNKGELQEKQDGEAWNSQEAESILSDSME